MKLPLILAQAAWVTVSQAQQVPQAVPFSTGFNSSFSLTAAQIDAAGLSKTLASSINAIVNFDRSSLANGGPRQDDFYNVPPKKSNLKAGQALKIQQVTDPTPYAIPAGSSLSKILYTTRNVNGTIIPASAYVLWPFVPRQFHGEAKGGDRKAHAVLWAHGTSGYFADAAPSSHRTLYYENIMPLALVQAGYAVVAPDYAGLGLEKSWDGSEIPHQYFASSAGGQDTLYAMQAALEAFPDRLSDEFAIMGHSQGGGVAWSAAELLALERDGEYKRLIKGYKGTIAIAPVTKTLSPPSFSALVASLRISSIFPDFDPSQWLHPLALKRAKLLQEIQGGATVAQQLFLSEELDAFMKADFYNSSYHARAFERLADVGGKPFAGPLLVIQGPKDVFIPEEVTGKAVTTTCELHPGSDLEYMVVQELGHTPIISAARFLWMNWLEERFGGKPINGCKRTSVTGWLGKGNHFAGSNSFAQWSGTPQYMYQNPGAV